MVLENNVILEDVQVRGHPSEESMVTCFAESPFTKNVRVLETHGDLTTYRREGTLCPPMVAFRKLGMLPNYPFTIEEGHYTIMVSGSREKVRALYSALREIMPGTAIVAIRHKSVGGDDALLTPRQQEVFQMALSAGYWDVPRRTNMTDLASVLHVAKSTLAETLSKIENKLLHEAFTLQLWKE